MAGKRNANDKKYCTALTRLGSLISACKSQYLSDKLRTFSSKLLRITVSRRNLVFLKTNMNLIRKTCRAYQILKGQPLVDTSQYRTTLLFKSFVANVLNDLYPDFDETRGLILRTKVTNVF